MTKHVVNYSGGEASEYSAALVAEEFGTADLTLLFADVFVEAADLYRFTVESAARVFRVNRPRKVEQLSRKALALPPLTLETIQWRKWALMELARETMRVIPGLVWIAEGRTPWEVFRDVKFIGNSRIDPCSRVLKREFLWRWIEANCDPAETVIYFGLDANEEHRLEAVRSRQPGWRVESPLISRDIYKEFIKAEAERRGLRRSESYELGYGHDNCAGACVKAGHGSWRLTLIKRPEVYAYAEAEEARTKAVIGRDDIGVLKDRKGGTSKPLDLKTFRERVEAGAQVDLYDLGGCGCAV